MVGAGDRPIPVEDAIIAEHSRSASVPTVPSSWRNTGSAPTMEVRITSGPLAGWSGVFESELSDSQRVVILIEALQQGRVVISRDLLELADAA